MRHCIFCGKEIDDTRPLPPKMLVANQSRWCPEEIQIQIDPESGEMKKVIVCGSARTNGMEDIKTPAVCCLKGKCQKTRKQRLTPENKDELRQNRISGFDRHITMERFKQHYTYLKKKAGA